MFSAVLIGLLFWLLISIYYNFRYFSCITICFWCETINFIYVKRENAIFIFVKCEMIIYFPCET